MLIQVDSGTLNELEVQLAIARLSVAKSTLFGKVLFKFNNGEMEDVELGIKDIRRDLKAMYKKGVDA